MKINDMIRYNIKTFSASELNQMTKQNLLGLPRSSALQHKIRVQQGCSQYSGTDFIVHQLQNLEGQ
jgi:hypothetical protein